MNLASKILAVVAVGLLCSPSYAQIGQGSIGGKVLDRDGKPLQGAIVRIESLASHQIDNFKTNKNGVYSASGLYQSQYKVTLIVDGLAVMVRGDKPGDAVFVNEGRDVNVNFDLRNAPATGLPAAAAAPAAPKPGNDKADKKADTETRAAFNAGIAALRAKNYDEAIQQFQIAAEKDPAQPIIFGNLAQALSGAKKYDESLAFIDRRLKEMPNEAPKLAKYRVTILTQAGRLDQAAQLASQLQGQEKAEALYSIGVSAWDKAYRDPSISLEERVKIVDMGLQALKQALDVKPDYFEAMAYYSLLFREKAKAELDGAKRLEYTATADEWLKKAVELRKKSQQQPKTPAKT